VHREIHGDLGRILKTAGVPVEQWRILLALRERSGQTVSELAERVFMNLPALSKNLDRMVSRALVHRTQDSADHRRVLLQISDFGLELLDEPERDLRQYYSALEARLGPRGVTRLNRLLQSLT
jgi:DNA-binding MarR family transcriptional regulator